MCVMKKLCFVFIGLLFYTGISAQDTAEKPEVAEEYKMFYKSMWRRMDFTIKQNKPFYSLNAELPRLLLEALDDGLLQVYRSDSCLVKMADSTLTSRRNFIVTEEVRVNPDDDYDTRTELKEVQKPWLFSDYKIAYLKEDVVFDRNRSRMYWYIRTISITIPATVENAEYGVASDNQKKLHFKYDEVAELMRNNEKFKDRALWYNGQNIAMHRNVIDAFELRLFHAPITKISNNEDLDLRTLYSDIIAKDPMQALIIQQQMEHDLAEYETELWSY